MLTNNLTTLVLNLLISENPSHRVLIAGRITEILDAWASDEWQIEEILRRQFTALLTKCVEDPACEQRVALRLIAEIYKEQFAVETVDLQVAA